MSTELIERYSEVFDLVFGGKHTRDMKSRKLDVIYEVIINPNASDKDIADKIFCSVSTVKKWRSLVKPGVGVSCKVAGKHSFCVRAK